MRKYGEIKMTRITMATVPHVTSGLGLRKFQADGFLLTWVYMVWDLIFSLRCSWGSSIMKCEILLCVMFPVFWVIVLPSSSVINQSWEMRAVQSFKTSVTTCHNITDDRLCFVHITEHIQTLSYSATCQLSLYGPFWVQACLKELFHSSV